MYCIKNKKKRAIELKAIERWKKTDNLLIWIGFQGAKLIIIKRFFWDY